MNPNDPRYSVNSEEILGKRPIRPRMDSFFGSNSNSELHPEKLRAYADALEAYNAEVDEYNAKRPDYEKAKSEADKLFFADLEAEFWHPTFSNTQWEIIMRYARNETDDRRELYDMVELLSDVVHDVLEASE